MLLIFATPRRQRHFDADADTTLPPLMPLITPFDFAAAAFTPLFSLPFFAILMRRRLPDAAFAAAAACFFFFR
jgi:hypothetical protein